MVHCKNQKGEKQIGQHELQMALFLFMVRPLYLAFYLHYKGALKLV